MKKLTLVCAAMFAAVGLLADTYTVREPGLVEGLVVGSGGIVTGLVGMTKDLLVGRTVTYTTPPGVPAGPAVAAVPPCAVVGPGYGYVQPVAATPVYTPPVIPSAPPVVVSPAGTYVDPYVAPYVPGPSPCVRPCRPVYRGWGPPPMRPRHYYKPCPAPYPGPYPRPCLR